MARPYTRVLDMQRWKNLQSTGDEEHANQEAVQSSEKTNSLDLNMDEGDNLLGTGIFYQDHNVLEPQTPSGLPQSFLMHPDPLETPNQSMRIQLAIKLKSAQEGNNSDLTGKDKMEGQEMEGPLEGKKTKLTGNNQNRDIEKSPSKRNIGLPINSAENFEKPIFENFSNEKSDSDGIKTRDPPEAKLCQGSAFLSNELTGKDSGMDKLSDENGIGSTTDSKASLLGSDSTASKNPLILLETFAAMPVERLKSGEDVSVTKKVTGRTKISTKKAAKLTGQKVRSAIKMSKDTSTLRISHQAIKSCSLFKSI